MPDGGPEAIEFPGGSIAAGVKSLLVAIGDRLTRDCGHCASQRFSRYDYLCRTEGLGLSN
jgi:hypothetical protein